MASKRAYLDVADVNSLAHGCLFLSFLRLIPIIYSSLSKQGLFYGLYYDYLKALVGALNNYNKQQNYNNRCEAINRNIEASDLSGNGKNKSKTIKYFGKIEEGHGSLNLEIAAKKRSS